MKKTKRHLKLKRSSEFSTTYFNNNYQKALTVSSFEANEQIDNLLDAYTKAKQYSRAPLLEEMNKGLETFLSKESTNEDATDRMFDFLRYLSDSVQEQFDELLAGDRDKNNLPGRSC